MIIYDNNNNPILDTQVEDDSYRYRAIMGENSLTLHIKLSSHIEIPVGSYCSFQGVRYTLERPQQLKMQHSRYFDYTVIMESASAKAKIWKFRNTVDGRLRFSMTAKPSEHLAMFVANMNTRDTGWTVGDCIAGEERLISYDHAYCLEALAQIASAFETEYEITGKRVSLRKIEYNKSTPLSLSYGSGNGFSKGVGRTNTLDTPPVEILYVQGGEKNIDPSAYGSKELLLPRSKSIKYDGEKFEGESGYVAANARTYETDASGLSVRRSDRTLQSYAEDSLDCSDIYPKRVGTISAVVVVDADKHFYDIVDSGIPGGLNYSDYLITGETLTIIFQSGMLAGREFEASYHHDAEGTSAPRRFELVPQELDGQTMPNASYAPVIGDKYAVFNCALPESYIEDTATKTGASWDMFRAAVRYLFDNEEQRFSFTGTLDGLWAKRDWLNIGGKILLGGYIRFSDTRFQPEGVLVRIVGIKDYINDPHCPEIELSNNVVGVGFSSTLKTLESEEVLIEDLHKRALTFTKRRYRDAKESLEMLDKALLANFTNGIMPATVQTMAMLVGDESLQFRFVTSKVAPVIDTSFAITYNNASKQLTCTAGIIQHMTLGLDNISNAHAASAYKYWDIPAYSSVVLDDGSIKYYLYAKVSKTAQTGVFLLSQTAIALEGLSGYYHLLLGVLNSEYEDERSFAKLYGFSEILPGRITTDKIISSDGRTYIDLANSEIGGIIKFINNGGTVDLLADVKDSLLSGISDAVEGTTNLQTKLSKLLQGGKLLHRDPEFASGRNGVNVYNNSANGNVTITRISRQGDVPTSSQYILSIVTSGPASPGLGGFYFGDQTRANAVFLTKIIAKIPEGYNLKWASNATGNNREHMWLTPTAGTGRYETYICVLVCGVSGTFSSTNFFYLEKTGATSAAWLIASAAVYDLSDTDLFALQREIQYLQDTFGDMSTVVSGGAVLSGLFGVRDNSENVVAGIAGKHFVTGDSKSPMIWAGASSLEEANNAAIRFYPDGTAYLSKGLFSGFLQMPFVNIITAYPSTPTSGYYSLTSQFCNLFINVDETPLYTGDVVFLNINFSASFNGVIYNIFVQPTNVKGNTSVRFHIMDNSTRFTDPEDHTPAGAYRGDMRQFDIYDGYLQMIAIPDGSYVKWMIARCTGTISNRVY